VREYTAAGKALWTRQFGPGHANGVAAGSGGSVYVAGDTTGSLPGQTSSGGDDAYVAKFTGIAAPPTGAADTPGVFDPATATWYLRSSATAGAPDAGQFAFGGPGWIPLVGDWTGSGTVGIGVFDPATATFYLKNSPAAGAPDFKFTYGGAGWTPVAGDWNGDGKWTVGVVDPSGKWYLRNSNSAGPPDIAPFAYGGAGWVPVVGDWGGNGATTVGVVDPATETWYLRNSNGPGAADIAPFAFGGPGWRPVVGDWNNDGVDGVGVLDPQGNWYLRNSPSAGAPDAGSFAYGAANWLPVPGGWSAGAGQTAAAAERVEAGPFSLTRELARTGLQAADPGALPAQSDAGNGWFVDPTVLQDVDLSAGTGFPGTPAATPSPGR
jgi:hypothetical protein